MTLGREHLTYYARLPRPMGVNFVLFSYHVSGKEHGPWTELHRKFQEDPYWGDYPLFYEYFHGDTGVAADASHQAGWSGVIVRIMHLFASFKAQKVLEQSNGESAGTVGPARAVIVAIVS